MLLLLKGERTTISVDPQRIRSLSWDEEDQSTDIWLAGENEPFWIDLPIEEVTNLVNQAISPWVYGVPGNVTLTTAPDSGGIDPSPITIYESEDHE